VRCHRVLYIPLILLLLAPLAGCDLSGQVERAIEAELPRVIGPADSYRARVEGLRATAGTAQRIEIVGQRVRPEGAPVLERLELELTGVRMDRAAQRIEHVEAASGEARIAPDDLVSFLETHRNVREARLALDAPDRATLRLRPTLAGLNLPAGATVELAGRLVARDGQIAFDVETLRAGGANLGAAAARQVSQSINPLVDLSDMPADLRVTAVRVADGRLQVEATGDPAGLSFR
jgi:hypothetical protein